MAIRPTILTNIKSRFSPMKLSTLAVALVAIAFPLIASAQDEGVQFQSIRADEQIILGQIMTDKRAISHAPCNSRTRRAARSGRL